eukprot:3678507-Prymnesium_polylepis.1
MGNGTKSRLRSPLAANAATVPRPHARAAHRRQTGPDHTSKCTKANLYHASELRDGRRIGYGFSV